MVVLRGGTVLEKEIRGGERHSYPVHLEQGQLLRAVVDQNGVDVTVRLLDPDGTPVLSVDSLTGRTGEEDCAAVAERTGLYRVEVFPGAKADPGRYELRVERPRRPSKRDLLRAEAVRAMAEAFAADHKESTVLLEQRLVLYEKALALWERLGERRRQAEMLFQVGKTLSNPGPGHFERAAGVFSQAAGLWGELGDREMGDLRLCVAALREAGLLHEKLSQWEDAQARFEEALAVATRAEDVSQQVAMLRNLGRIARYRGNARAAVGSLLRAVGLARQIGDKKGEASALNGLGAAYMELSDRQQALSSYKEAREICREIGDLETESSVLANLGDAYESLGEWEKALENHDESLRLHRKLEDPTGEATVLNNLGVVHQRLGDYGKALEHFGQALAIARETGDKDQQAQFLINQGFVHLLRGEADKAREASLQALELGGDRGDVETEARHALGSAYRLLGNCEAARPELDQALARTRKSGNRTLEAKVMLSRAYLEKDCGNLTEALSLTRQSVSIVESLRTGVVSQDLRAAFLASKQIYYELQIEILMALHTAEPGKAHAAEAFRVSEQARARSLLETLQEGGADIRQGAPAELLDQERRLRDEISERELQRLALRGSGTATAEQVAEAERKLKESLEAYEELQEGLLASSSRYAMLTQPRPLEVAEIQTQVLAGDALLLEYFLGPERSYLWAVTPDSLQSYVLPRRDRIQEVARQYYDLLTARNRPVAEETVVQTRERLARLDAELERTAAELSGIVLGPVRHLLGDQHLLVVSDGALQYIPFAALPIPGTTTPLIEKHEVVNLPSASVLAVLRDEIRDRPAAPLTLAVLADPVFQKDDPRVARLRRSSKDEVAKSSTHRGAALPGLGREGETDLESFWRLRHSRIEADAITALLPPDQTFKAVDFDASRETATSGRLAGYRNVHFATHGDVRSDHPELSSLVLSLFDEQGEPVDGFLRLNDIYNLELRADLVVLSACRTALGKEIRGEGLIGLTRGFMYAGAARVLATLWSVDDRATAEFMKHFYRAMLIEELSPAAALRKAQLAMINTPNRKPPYFWAGFSLQGEWK